jgi:phosphohistidine phosphatase
MELYLLRHGIPVDPEDWSGSDRSRPLTDIGRSQTRAVIQALQAKHGLAVDAIWTSPHVRTEETARIAASVLGIQNVASTPALASGADLTRSLFAAQSKPASWPARLLLVGHQPDLGLLVGWLTGDIHFPYGFGRAGAGRLQGPLAAGAMNLEWLLTADEALRG